MKFTVIKPIIAFSFSAAATPFGFSREYVAGGHVTKTCAKALTAKIECDNYVPDMNLNHYQKWVGDVELADKICTDTCSDSFRIWNDTVTKDCAEDMNGSDSNPRYTTHSLINTISQMWQGFNETCVKDTESGRYCQEIFDGFSDIPKHQERPFKELCHPCYGKVLTVMSKSFLWSKADFIPRPTGDGYWHNQLDLVRKKCDGSNSTATASDSPTETATQELIEGPTPYGPTDPGISSDCSFFQTIIKDLDDCGGFASDWAITLKEFVEYNPTIKDDCSGIQLGHSYCVEVNHGHPRKEASSEATTTQEVEPQPTEDEELIPSQGSLKDPYKEFFEASKQAILGKYRDLAGQSVSGQHEEAAPEY